MRRAYRNLDSPPEELDQTTCCLPDDRGCLHTAGEAAAGTFLINDKPALASAALAAGVPFAFADAAGGQLTGFLTATEVRALSGTAIQRSMTEFIRLDRRADDPDASLGTLRRTVW